MKSLGWLKEEGAGQRNGLFVSGHLIGLLLDSRLADDLMGHTKQSVIVIPERQTGLRRDKVAAGWVRLKNQLWSSPEAYKFVLRKLFVRKYSQHSRCSLGNKVLQDNLSEIAGTVFDAITDVGNGDGILCRLGKWRGWFGITVQNTEDCNIMYAEV